MRAELPCSSRDLAKVVSLVQNHLIVNRNMLPHQRRCWEGIDEVIGEL
jgi:hypothetical protein